MRIRIACCARGAAVAALLAASAATLHAQQPDGPRHYNVISANPFGLLLEFFNAEYERVVSESATVGVGGSFISRDDEDYVNTDVFFRFYPSGNALEGWTFGAKIGITSVEGGTYFGYGFDSNWSWLRGANNNFYVGIGFGLKRLVNAPDDLDLRFVPTIRIVNIGFAF